MTSGAAAAIQSGLAGILTGDNEAFIRQLPDLTGMKSEVIIQKSHRNPFDHQLRSTGIKLIEIETRDELRQAVNDRTAMMHFSNFANAAGQIKVDEWVKLAKQYNVPCMNDAAADTPPVSHLWDYTNMGYDLVTFSGGKAMRGPQCAGLLIGRKDLVAYALLNNSPHEDTLGRSQKVGKEEIIGMVKALELYLKEDHDALAREWQDRLERISRELTKVPGVSTSFFVPDIANHVPHMQITWDSRVSLEPKQVSKVLRSSKPAIVIGGGEGRPGLTMCSFMLQPGEDKIVAEQLARVLARALSLSVFANQHDDALCEDNPRALVSGLLAVRSQRRVVSRPRQHFHRWRFNRRCLSSDRCPTGEGLQRAGRGLRAVSDRRRPSRRSLWSATRTNRWSCLVGNLHRADRACPREHRRRTYSCSYWFGFFLAPVKP